MEDGRAWDLLDRVHEVCRLHWHARGVRDVQLEKLESGGIGYLRVSYTSGDRGQWPRHDVVGVSDGPSREVLEALHRLATESRAAECRLVHRGPSPSADLVSLADERGVWLQSLEDYQLALWPHTDYVAGQTAALLTDPDYPLALHVDKRWAPLGEKVPAAVTAVPRILAWLGEDGPCFVLVLGDFGTGKTFLLHVLAHRLAVGGGLVPVLVTMRDLEKGRSLDELLAQHMTRAGQDPFHGAGFRHLLREGRIALLFDGFDELALRTSYDRVEQHFATLREAAGGSAKVVVTSRHQYFATDRSVRKAMGEEVHRLPGSHIIRLFPLGGGQRAELIVATFGGDAAAAERFTDVLRAVPNLPELAANPRMLTFMLHWYREGILTADVLAGSAAAGEMTAGALYQLLLTTWLEHEVARQTADGGLPPLTVAQRMDAVRQTAVRMWRTGRHSIALVDLGEVADGIVDLARLDLRGGEAAQAVGSSTVLVRTPDDEFAFIHQSVMEWFVADVAWRTLVEDGPAALGVLLADHALTAPMADFLCDLAGVEAVLDWARALVAAAETPGPSAKANATLVLQRRRASTGLVDYSDQDLRGQDLSGAELTGADLSRAELTGAVLPKALRGARFVGATLTGVWLAGADLRGADLRGADLRRAWLAGADLTDAVLDGARLDRAVLLGATVTGGALRRASTAGAALPGDRPVFRPVGRSRVSSAALLPDATLLFTAHVDGTVRVMEPATGRPVRAYAEAGQAEALVADPLGRWLALVEQGRVRRLDLSSGELAEPWDQLPEVTAVAVSPDGQCLAFAGADRTVQLWSVRTGQPYRIAPCPEPLRALAFDADGRRLVGAGPTTMTAWNPRSGDELDTVVLPAEYVGALGVNLGGQHAAAVTAAGLFVWTVGLTSRLTPIPVRGGPRTVVELGGGRVAIGAEREVQVLGPAGTVQHTLHVPWPQRSIGMLVSSQEGVRLAALSSEGDVQFWNSVTARPLTPTQLGMTRTPIRALTPHRDGRLLVAGVGSLWDIGQAAMVDPGSWVSHHQTSPTVSNPVTGEFVTPVIRTLRIWGDDGTPKRHLPLPKQLRFASGLAVSADGQLMAASGLLQPDFVIMKFGDGAVVRSYHLRGDSSVQDLEFDPLGRWLAVTEGSGRVSLWRTGGGWRGRLRTMAGDHYATALAVSPDGSWLAAGGLLGEILRWDTATGRLLSEVRHGGSTVRRLVVAPHGRWLAAVHDDGVLRIFEPDAPQPTRVVTAHLGMALAVAVDPVAGRWLATAGEDGVVRVWDPDTGLERATLVGVSGGWAMVRPDGRVVTEGRPEGLWWSAGLCRFDPDDLNALAPYLPGVGRATGEEFGDLVGG